MIKGDADSCYEAAAALRRIADRIDEGYTQGIDPDWDITMVQDNDSLNADISNDAFDSILAELIKRDAATILSIPNTYETLSEHYNNEILNIYERRRREKIDVIYNGVAKQVAADEVAGLCALRDAINNERNLSELQADNPWISVSKKYGGFAYRDEESDNAELCVIGFDYNRHSYMANIRELFAEHGVMVSFDYGQLYVEDDEDCCFDDFFNEVSNEIKRLCGIDVDFVQDWEFAPPTIKVQFYDEVPYREPEEDDDTE